jgi:FkbM family methyltransferase
MGRLIGSQTVSARSIGFDRQYLRGYASRLQANNLRSEMFGRFAQAAKICASANRSIDPEMHRLFPKSHGQLLQDIVCTLIHDGKRDGYFVEVGVGDGITYSNTLMLERDFGWRGILAEPAAMFHNAILGSRKSTLDWRAVSSETGNVLVFEQNNTVGELSGLAGTRTRRGKQALSTYNVETIRLDELLDEKGAPDEIDYISIDTEGSELSVLSGLSLAKRKVWFFTIEHNFDPIRIREYDELLIRIGYRRILPHLSEFDSWYAHGDLGNGIF